MRFEGSLQRWDMRRGPERVLAVDGKDVRM